MVRDISYSAGAQLQLQLVDDPHFPLSRDATASRKEVEPEVGTGQHGRQGAAFGIRSRGSLSFNPQRHTECIFFPPFTSS